MVVIRIISCNACIIKRFLCGFLSIVSMENKMLNTRLQTHTKCCPFRALFFFLPGFCSTGAIFFFFEMRRYRSFCGIAWWIKYEKHNTPHFFNPLYYYLLGWKKKNTWGMQNEKWGFVSFRLKKYPPLKLIKTRASGHSSDALFVWNSLSTKFSHWNLCQKRMAMLRWAISLFKKHFQF